MRVPVYNEKGTRTESTVELPKEIFGIKPNLAALRQFIHVYQTNQRQGTAATKTRGAVSGGGRKPWVQKGTGRARHGSIRSPIWVGGGTTFGPQPRNFSASLPQKVRNLALRSALSEKAAAGRVFVVGAFAPKEPRTSRAAQLLRKLQASSPLVITPDADAKILRSFRNIPGVTFSTVANLNPYAVVRSRSILLLKESIDLLKHRLGVAAAEASNARDKKVAPVRKRLPAGGRAGKVKPRGKKR